MMVRADYLTPEQRATLSRWLGRDLPTHARVNPGVLAKWQRQELAQWLVERARADVEAHRRAWAGGDAWH